MNETNTNPNPTSNEPVADALIGLGRDWASYGLKMAKMALEQSGSSLTRLAGAIDTFRGHLEAATTPERSTPPARPENPPNAGA